jgi:O-acetyl-ADP-ribose deacetylase (regulator of RNase III)
MTEVIKGNLFSSNCQCIVNTINCVGVMGAGIAYECRLRYPKMFERYAELCQKKLINIGTLWLYKSDFKWILNFPTKYHWKYESKIEYLEKGLQKFLDTYKEKGITSIAFPILGANNGGIAENVSIQIMKKYLEKCDIPVEIYYYDPEAYDDLFIRFKKLWKSIPEQELSKKSGIRIDFVRKVKIALENDSIRSLNRLLTVKGIGDATLEKSFHFINNFKQIEKQLNFDNQMFPQDDINKGN